METMFLICAIVGGHGDTGGHDFAHDFGGHDVVGHHGDVHSHDSTHGNQSSWFFGLLTFRTLTAAVAFFGFTGLAALRLELEPLPALAVSVGAGVAAIFLVGSLMRFLSRLNVDGTIRIERSMGTRGTVYLTVPGKRSGVGKVQVSVMSRLIEYKAVTANDALSTGSKIVVVGIVAPDTVEVAPATASQS
jgi:hypothetical protein